MPFETYEQLLDRAAGLRGIDPGFWDIWSRYHPTSTEAKKAVLRAMGMEVETREQLEKSLAQRTRREWERVLPPALVVSESQPREFYINVPAASLSQAAQATVRREDGAVHDFQLNFNELPQIAWMEMEGSAWARKRARISFDLPLGYHEVSIRIGALSACMRYIVTPDRAWAHPHLSRSGRAAGVAISLYGLRSQRNWGCGDFTDLLEVVDWVAEKLEASFIALNPLNAIHNRLPFNTSPYLPNSSFYRNYLYLDVESVEDYARSQRAQRLRQSPQVRAEIESLRAAQFVEYERVSGLKLRFLSMLFVEFLREWRTGSPRAREFDAFVASEGDLLEKFATYCALDSHLHKQDPNVWNWPEWPDPYRDPESPETRAFRKKHWRAVMFQQYLQWQIAAQLQRAQQRARQRQLSIGLYHDLALATDRFGSDLWAHRPFFATGCEVGAPPDDFSPKGQAWGFPPPNSERHREDGYRLFAESIRKNCQFGGALRIDHVMRFFRLYWIPHGSDASQGVYVRETSEDYARILALESVRNQVVVIGEDLGTVESSIRESLARLGILSYRVLYFEKDNSGNFRKREEYPAQALVSSTTHDLPTLAGFWVGEDIRARLAAGLLDKEAFPRQLETRQEEKQKILNLLFDFGMLPNWVPRRAAEIPELTGELHNAIVGFLATTPCQLMVVNQEDVTKELEQQNLPGSTSQYPNWRRKMRFTVEELRSGEEVGPFAWMLRNWIVNSGRRNQPG